MEARPILADLAVVLCVAAATSLLFHRLRQPVVLGYLLAGLIVGPHTSFPLFADAEHVRTLSDLGVILVMFCIGLEFSVRRLARVVPSAGIIVAIEVFGMLWLGYLAGQALGWDVMASLFAGAVVAIPSTMVVVKVLGEQSLGGRIVERVYGVLIVGDLAAIVLIAFLTSLVVGKAAAADDVLLPTVGRLVAVLVGLVLVGLLVVPRLVRYLALRHQGETLLVATMGICFAFALAAWNLGYSVALGAFIAGSLVAESGEPARVLRLVAPLRDVFAAVFFVSVGMLVDPSVILAHWPAALLLSAVVVLGQTATVGLGSFLSGDAVRDSLRTGMMLVPIGEFSFLIATLGVDSGAAAPELLSIVVAVATFTTFLAPWLVRASKPVALWVDSRLPRRVQTVASLYGTWIETLRQPAHRDAVWARGRRLFVLLAVDAASLAAIIIAASMARDPLLAMLHRHLSMPELPGEWLVVLAAAVAGLPFLIGLVRCARGLGRLLAVEALPLARPGAIDLADAPRRTLIVIAQLLVMLVAFVPLLAVTQPFVPALSGAPLLVALFVVAGAAFWRRATNLQEHVVAGAQMVVEALVPRGHAGLPGPAGAGRDAAGAAGGTAGAAPGSDSAGDGTGVPSIAFPTMPRPAPTIDQVQGLLPGMGTMVEVRIADDSVVVGRTLGEIELRGLTGATVIAIARDGQRLVAPSGGETLRAGDVLAVTGTQQAVADAAEMLSARAG